LLVKATLLLRILCCPVTSSLDCSVLVLLPALCNIVGERIVGIRCAKKGLDGEEDSSDLEGGRPVALQNVKADSAESVDVGMVDLGEEADFGRGHRVVIRKEKLKLEGAILVR